MNPRAVALILISSAAMMLLMFTLNKNNPPQPPQANIAQKEDVDKDSPRKDSPDKDSPDKRAQSSDSEEQTPDESKSKEGTTSAVATDEKTEKVITPENPSKPAAIQKFVSVGSLDPSSSHRYLITINPNGGTIRRIEVNFKNPAQDDFRYRDLENPGGYLGCLDCIDTPEGCLIRTVGHGTPAYQAMGPNAGGGIQAGDLLVAINDEPLTKARELDQWLEKSKAGDSVELSVKRSGSEGPLKFKVDLIRKPIEVVHPEFHEYAASGTEYPESFQLNLLNPSNVLDAAWPEIDGGMHSLPWSVTETSENEIECRYDIAPEKLSQFNLEKISVIKRFRLPRLTPEQIHAIDSRSFHFEMDVEVVNGSDKDQKVTYELDGPSGLTTETWWYTQKIHGRSTAIGYSAGARDVIGSTHNQSFIFYGCPEITDGSLAARPDPKFICSPFLKDTARELKWVGVDAQYFNVTLLPKLSEGEKFNVNSVTAYPIGTVEKNKKYNRLTNCSFQLFKTLTLPPGNTAKQTFEIFAGPKDKRVLYHYGLDETRTFGWFAWFSKPLMWLLHFFYKITGSFSYGIAIVMLTVLVRSLMIPISRKAAINAQMMQLLQPQMQEIRERFKDNPEKQGLETRELFRKHRYNPLSGCFLGLLQLPIFLGLFRGLSVDIGLRDQPLIPGMQWCNNLSGPDQFLNWSSWMPSFLSDKIGFFGPYLNILPLITVVLFLVQQKMFMPPPTDDQQRLMQKMLTFMMVFMGIMFFKVAAGLCIYFITSSIWGILERKLLPKPTLDAEKFATAGTAPSPSGGGLLAKAMSLVQDKSQADKSSSDEIAERKQRNADRKKRLKNRDR